MKIVRQEKPLALLAIFQKSFSDICTKFMPPSKRKIRQPIDYPCQRRPSPSGSSCELRMDVRVPTLSIQDKSDVIYCSTDVLSSLMASLKSLFSSYNLAKVRC